MNRKKYFAVLGSTLLIFAAVMCGILTARFIVAPFALGEHGNALDILSRGDDENILVVGLDKVGYNTDVILIVNIDSKNHSINIISVPRDTRVPLGNSHFKVNAVYAYAMNKGLKKEEQLISSVSNVTGIPIHHYAVMDLEGFRKIIDALGGVEFDVTRNYYYSDPAQDLLIDIKKGYQTLDGKNAEGLIRYRDDYVMGDLDRIPVQQDFMRALISQKLRPEYIGKIPEIYRTLSANVVSDLTVSDVIKYGKKALKSEANINAVMLPGTPSTIRDVSYFLCDTESTKALMDNDFVAASAE
jgi:LCP family protein required for cell wall assembly